MGALKKKAYKDDVYANEDKEIKTPTTAYPKGLLVEDVVGGRPWGREGGNPRFAAFYEMLRLARVMKHL